MFNEQLSRIPTSPDQFKGLLLAVSLASIKMNNFSSNYDFERFGSDKEDKSKDFGLAERIFWLEWFFAHYEDLYQAMASLSEAKSQSLFMNLIAYRIAGHLSLKIDVDLEDADAMHEQFVSQYPGNPSEHALSGRFGGLRRYEFPLEGHEYKFDVMGFRDTLFRGQYFLSEDDIEVQPEEGDHVVDGGACVGDTCVIFAKAVGKSGAVYGFDPVQEHLELIEHNGRLNPDCNIVAMPYGLSDSDVDARPIHLGTYDPAFNLRRKTETVPLRSVDSLVSAGTIPRVDFLKLDVEGSEMDALKGSARTIEKHLPKLAISLYHKPTDLFEIINWVASNFPVYSLFVRHYTIHREETVLYGVA